LGVIGVYLYVCCVCKWKLFVVIQGMAVWGSDCCVFLCVLCLGEVFVVIQRIAVWGVIGVYLCVCVGELFE
jgi:hypothetical protein